MPDTSKSTNYTTRVAVNLQHITEKKAVFKISMQDILDVAVPMTSSLVGPVDVLSAEIEINEAGDIFLILHREDHQPPDPVN